MNYWKSMQSRNSHSIKHREYKRLQTVIEDSKQRIALIEKAYLLEHNEVLRTKLQAQIAMHKSNMNNAENQLILNKKSCKHTQISYSICVFCGEKVVN
jgi:hypothetical protein